MRGRPFRLCYDQQVPLRPVFEEAIGRDGSIELVPVPGDGPKEAARAALAGCHGYYAFPGGRRGWLSAPVTSQFLARQPDLLLVVTYGAGYDSVDVDACTAAGVAVVNQSGGNAEAVAEHAVGFMLGLLKRVPEAQAALRAGTASESGDFMGRELLGRTVGIVGLGHVGTRTAEIVRTFGCRVLAFDPYVDAATCTARGAVKVTLPELLAESEIVSVHCPLTAETAGMLDRAAFKAMPRDAVFVTTARGGIHDEDALYAALVDGTLAGAGVDVWEEEPPPAGHPLLGLPNVLATRHTAGVTIESRTRLSRMAAAAFSAGAAGEALPRLVNPEVAPSYAERWAAAFG